MTRVRTTARLRRLVRVRLDGWSFDEVLPYFKRLETSWRGASAWHGGEGPVQISRMEGADLLWEPLLAAAQAAGIAYCDDPNGAEQDGISMMESTVGGGRRASSARAYLIRHGRTQSDDAHALFRGSSCAAAARPIRYSRRAAGDTGDAASRFCGRPAPTARPASCFGMAIRRCASGIDAGTTSLCGRELGISRVDHSSSWRSRRLTGTCGRPRRVARRAVRGGPAVRLPPTMANFSSARPKCWTGPQAD